jgi:hypothetical protein
LTSAPELLVNALSKKRKLPAKSEWMWILRERLARILERTTIAHSIAKQLRARPRRLIDFLMPDAAETFSLEFHFIQGFNSLFTPPGLSPKRTNS